MGKKNWLHYLFYWNTEEKNLLRYAASKPRYSCKHRSLKQVVTTEHQVEQ